MNQPVSDIAASNLDGQRTGDFSTVGFQLFKIERGPEERTLPVAVWYPGLKPRDLEPHVYLGFIPKTAYLNLEPQRQMQLPVIIFSHGNRGVKEQSVTIMEELARSGYVVFAIDHSGNTFFEDPIENESLNIVMNHLRPMDVTALINWLTDPTGEQQWLAEVMDLDRIGVIGHSRGGFTALALVGAYFDTSEAYETTCTADTWDVCSTFPTNAAPWDLSDPRIRTAVAMAPASYTITEAGLANVSRPVLVMAGKQDQTTTFSGTVRPIYDGLNSPKTLWTSETAGHYTFSDLCRVYELLGDSAAFLGADCAGRTTDQIDTAHENIVRAAVAWFDVHLKDRLATDQLRPKNIGEYQIETE
jgi:predicted dienelactone hydrolase